MGEEMPQSVLQFNLLCGLCVSLDHLLSKDNDLCSRLVRKTPRDITPWAIKILPILLYSGWRAMSVAEQTSVAVTRMEEKVVLVEVKS